MEWQATYRVAVGVMVRKRLTAGNWYLAKAKAFGLGLDLERRGEFPPGWAVVEVEALKEAQGAPPRPRPRKKRCYVAVYDCGYGVRSFRNIEAYDLEEAQGIALRDEDIRQWLVAVKLKHLDDDGVSRR